MKSPLVIAALLLAASVGTAHALTIEAVDGSSASAKAALADPDEALQKKFDGQGNGTTSIQTGSGTFTYGFSARSPNSRDGVSSFDRMMPWASEPSSGPGLGNGRR